MQTIRRNLCGGLLCLRYLLYLAAEVCFTAIAMQSADMTANLKTTLLVEAGMLMQADRLCYKNFFIRYL
ncbi:hypothetical protein [Nostoc sp.]|uniref:hypothetical protein n=1 Tax=Nostoc sp. TaxID=1180 RepID=UPI002FFB04B0